METNRVSFSSLNFGTTPSTTKLEVVEVALNGETMLRDYATAYAKELYRRNPVRAREVSLTEEELFDYFSGLLALRVMSVNGESKYWRQAKALVIPAWIQFTISTVGEVIDYDRGLKMVPTIRDYEVNMDKMLETSMQLAAFEGDGIHLLHDAMPRDAKGDAEVMSFALIDDYVMGMNKVAHPIASYVSAFLGFELAKGAAFNALYRVRYDDVEFIKSMLMSTKEVF